MASLNIHQVEAVLQTIRNCRDMSLASANAGSNYLRQSYYKGRADGYHQAARLLDEMLQIEVRAEAMRSASGSASDAV